MSNIAFGRVTQNVGLPPFVIDRDTVVRDTGHQIDWDKLDESYEEGAVTIQTNGAALSGATSLTVDPLPVDVPAGALLEFGSVNVEVTTKALAGATTLAIEAASGAIADNTPAYFDANLRLVGKHVKAGTVMCLLASGMMVPRAVRPGSETAFAILATNADETSINATDAASGYGVLRSAAVYENLLPEATGSPAVINSTYKTELIAAGGFWLFDQYQDTTA